MASSVISQALKAFKSSSLSPCLCVSVSCDPFPFPHLFWLLLCLTCDFSADAGAVHPSGGTYSLFSLTRTSHREGRLRLVLNDVISDRDAPIDRQSADSEPVCCDVTLTPTDNVFLSCQMSERVRETRAEIKTNERNSTHRKL